MRHLEKKKTRECVYSTYAMFYYIRETKERSSRGTMGHVCLGLLLLMKCNKLWSAVTTAVIIYCS